MRNVTYPTYLCWNAQCQHLFWQLGCKFDDTFTIDQTGSEPSGRSSHKRYINWQVLWLWLWLLWEWVNRLSRRAADVFLWELKNHEPINCQLFCNSVPSRPSGNISMCIVCRQIPTWAAVHTEVTLHRHAVDPLHTLDPLIHPVCGHWRWPQHFFLSNYESGTFTTHGKAWSRLCLTAFRLIVL